MGSQETIVHLDRAQGREAAIRTTTPSSPSVTEKKDWTSPNIAVTARVPMRYGKHMLARDSGVGITSHIPGTYPSRLDSCPIALYLLRSFAREVHLKALTSREAHLHMSSCIRYWRFNMRDTPDP